MGYAILVKFFQANNVNHKTGETMAKLELD